MNLRTTYWVFSFFLFINDLKTQNPTDFLPADVDAAPAWVRHLYSENPNVHHLDSLYEAYYRSQPFEKTTHTQYYKRWRRAAEPYVQPDGSVVVPTTEERARRWEGLIRQRQTAAKSQLPAWECLGPFETHSTGAGQVEVSWQVNVYTLDQSAGQPDVLYAGTEAGGIFKTTDKGLTWTFASNGTPMRTVTAVKIHPADPQTVYAGADNALYRTNDGGSTWTLLTGYDGGRINDISINPADPQVVLAAATGGLFRSTDGGQNWSAVFSDPVYDIEIRPGNPDVIYVLKNNPSARRAEFLRSADRGATWTLQEQGWYSSTDPDRADFGGRLTVTEADPGRIYAVLIGQAKAGDNGFIGIYRSDDGGDTWTLPNPPAGGPYTAGHPNLASINPDGSGFHQGYYNLSIAAADQDPDRLLIGFLSLWKSEDGATTFTPLGGYQGNVPWVHPDIQEIEINGSDIWVATDGGIDYSTDFFATKSSRKQGITASDYWGFDSGWNEDVLVGGRYHNGNSGYFQTYPAGHFLRLGGAEAPTGYVNPGFNRRAYFSDIGGRVLPETYEGSAGSFSVGLFPTESYFSVHSSEMTFDPRYYNHLYLGSGNQLWKSTDGGRSFLALHAFGSASWRVLKIEIARSNPEVIYVTVDPGFGNNGYLYRSNDGGATWTPRSLPPAGNTRRMQISLSPTDADRLWVGFRDGADGAKVFFTADSGQSWQNLTTAQLNGERVHDLLHAGGTDSGVYLGTDQAVYYRNDATVSWLAYSEGLPLSTSTNLLRPFYRDGKLRLGAYGRGLWQTDLHESFAPVAQPMVDKAESFCSRDTFYFEDHSILRHAGAAWHWSFPGAAYVSDPQTRNPRVVYDAPGVYDVILTVTQGDGQTSTKTEEGMVTVTGGCEPDPQPGLALDLGGEAGDYAVGEALNLQSNTLTFSAWIKPAGAQNPWAGIIFCRGGTTTAGLNFGDNQELRYHWNGEEWWWNPGLQIPADEWSHVALVVEPARATLYLNGVPAVHNVPHEPEAFDADLLLGADPHSETRRFRGLLEEVCLYRRALSTAEIRELMHLTRDPAADPDLLAYYQFNRSEGAIADRAGTAHLSLAGNTGRTTSTAPVGPGASSRIAAPAAGDNDFSGANLRLSFAADALPAGELVATRLDRYPDQLPGPAAVLPAYWIVHHFGASGGAMPGPTAITLTQLNRINRAESWLADRIFELYCRPATADGPAWLEPPAMAEGVEPGPAGTLVFGPGSGLTGSRQLVLMRRELEPESPGIFELDKIDRHEVSLRWEPSQKSPPEGFQVERQGENEADFYPIGRVPNLGENVFRFRDMAPLQGVSRYRLRYLYADQPAKTSPSRMVHLNNFPKFVLLYPNPIRSGQELRFKTKLEGPYGFFLFDTRGNRILHTHQEGDTQIRTEHLPPGPYTYFIDHPQRRFRGVLIIH